MFYTNTVYFAAAWFSHSALAGTHPDMALDPRRANLTERVSADFCRTAYVWP
jgi:hypothetical protein